MMKTDPIAKMIDVIAEVTKGNVSAFTLENPATRNKVVSILVNRILVVKFMIVESATF